MPRSLPAAALAAAVLFAACASSPPPLPPLALGERFDVVYDGRVGVLPPMEPGVAEATSALAALNGSTADAKAAATDDAGTGTAAVRLWLIELPADDPDARALADGAAVKAARPIHARGAHITPKASSMPPPPKSPIRFRGTTGAVTRHPQLDAEILFL